MRAEAPTISVGLRSETRGTSWDDVSTRSSRGILADLELVVSDNASEDGTQELLAEYADTDARIG